jgi:hypothetical protein
MHLNPHITAVHTGEDTVLAESGYCNTRIRNVSSSADVNFAFGW